MLRDLAAVPAERQARMAEPQAAGVPAHADLLIDQPWFSLPEQACTCVGACLIDTPWGLQGLEAQLQALRNSAAAVAARQARVAEQLAAGAPEPVEALADAEAALAAAHQLQATLKCQFTTPLIYHLLCAARRGGPWRPRTRCRYLRDPMYASVLPVEALPLQRMLLRPRSSCRLLRQ